MLSPRDQRGTVTAEAALVLPVIAAFCLALVWMVSVAIAQIRVVDAARDAARSVARGDDSATAAAQARRGTPEGAHVVIERTADTATATVSVRVSAPNWLLVPLPAVTVESQAAVEVENGADTP
jgi:Flp pilus assembly protein TadG